MHMENAMMPVRRRAALACLFVLLGGSGRAQWEQTAGPRGWTVSDMAELRGTVYAATMEGAVFRSRTNGAAWEACGAGISGWQVLRLRVLDGDLYALTGFEDGLCRSQDGGDTWKRIGPDSVYAMDAAVIGHRLLLVSASCSPVWSDNDGATWHASARGLPNRPDAEQLERVGNTLFLLCNQKLYRSADSGSSWTRADPAFSGGPIDCLAVHGGTLIVSTDANVYRSTDDGGSWMAATPVLDRCTALWQGGEAVFAMNDGTVYRSPDDGATWTAAATIPDRFWQAGNAFFIPERGGQRRSDDGGLSWTSIDCAPIGTSIDAFARRGNRLAVATKYKNVCVSFDAGDSWTAYGADMANHWLFCLAFAGDNLLAGGTCTSGGIDLTDNNGASWCRVSDTLGSYGRIQAEAFAVREPAVIAAGNGIWISTNSGRSWTADPQQWPNPCTYFQSVFFADSVLCAAGDFFTRSTDGGGHWEPEQDDSESEGYTFATAVGGMVYALVQPLIGSELRRSADAGRTWTRIGSGIADSLVTDIAGEGPCLFASTHGEGVFLSEDSGATWKAVNGGLGAMFISKLHVAGGRLFAGSCGLGVWRASIADLVGAAHAPASVTLEQNFPNPFSATAVIRYGLPDPCSVTLRVFDLLGRELRSMQLGSQSAGLHTVRLDASGLSDGTYVYRLEAGASAVDRRMTVLR
jgi:photosystem II stability/assembly factor-like uncharacterized protein